MMATRHGGQRKEDQSLWAWFDYVTTKYKFFIWLSIAILTSAGFGLRLPIQTANETKNQINSRIDSSSKILQSEIDEIKIQHKNIAPQIDAVKDDLNILLRLGCADKYMNSHDKYVSGLDCKK